MLTLWATRIHGDSHMNTMSVLGCRSSDSKYECEYQCNNGKSALLEDDPWTAGKAAVCGDRDDVAQQPYDRHLRLISEQGDKQKHPD